MTLTSVAIAQPSSGLPARPLHPECAPPHSPNGVASGERHAARAGLANTGDPRARARPASSAMRRCGPVGQPGVSTAGARAPGSLGRPRASASVGDRKRSLRMVRAALGLVLLACAGLTALPGTARAQTELWSATLTVGKNAASTSFGYQALAYGSLVPNSFTHGSATIIVSTLAYATGTLGSDLKFSLAGLGTLGTGTFTLHIGSKTFEIIDPGANQTFDGFTDHGLSWSVGDTVTVRLTEGAADTTGPAFESAEVPAAGDSLVITFDEDLDEDTAHKPATSRFTVEADSTEIDVDSFTVSGKTVTLSLGDTIDSGQTVTVSYEDPSSDDNTRAIQDEAGNDAPGFTDESVTNSSTQGTSMTPATCTGTEVWSATLTVGELVHAGRTFRGYADISGTASDFGSLSDDSFTEDSTDYTVTQLYFDDETRPVLYFRSSPGGQNVFDGDYTLCLGTSSLGFGDTTVIN